jgi:tetratricopeptide (TPR) repeat protein
MRKFLAVILALAFAFLVITGVILWKKGTDFKTIDLNDIKDLWVNLVTEKEKTPSVPGTEEAGTVITETPEEQDLGYDERLAKGDYYFERGFLTFASNEYVKAANLEPTRMEPYLRLLQTNFELGDYAKAKTNAETILKTDPGNIETQFKLALIYIKQSEFENAKSALEKLQSSQNPDPKITYYMALLSIAFDDTETGQKLLKQAKSQSTDAELDKKIDVYLGSYTEYEFAKSAEPLYLAELLARSYNKTGEYEMAIYKLKKILKTRSDLRDAWILFGFAYLNLEKYYFAQSAFERAYELDSEWPTTQYFLGLTYAELGNTKDSIIYLNYALSNNFEPQLVIYRKLADLYMETADYTKAVESYEKVLELNNEDINSFVRPIWIYLDYLNQPDKALKIAEVAVTTFPENAMAYNLLGWSQAGLKNFVGAEKNLKKSLEIDPNLAAAHYNLANMYKAMGNNDSASKEYQKAYELDQNGSIGNLAAKAYNDLLIKQ